MPSPVEQHEQEAEDDEEGQDAVEDRHAAEDDAEPVDREEQRGDGGVDDRAAERARDEVEHEHGRRAEERDREAPAEAGVRAEQRHARPDDPLAERRVHDVARIGREDAGLAREEPVVGILRPRRRVAQMPLAPGILHVVRLVEHDRVRMREIPEAQDAGEQRHEQRVPGRSTGDTRADRCRAADAIARRRSAAPRGRAAAAAARRWRSRCQA